MWTKNARFLYVYIRECLFILSYEMTFIFAWPKEFLATMLRHLGVKIDDIQQYLGNSDILTTYNIYVNFEQEQNKTLLNLLVDILKEEDLENVGLALIFLVPKA